MRPRKDKMADVKAEFKKILDSLHRVIVFVNGKGGTGKTTCCVNCAAATAQGLAEVGSTKRVLVMEFDKQGNTMTDLGIKDSDEDDKGKGILLCLMGAGEPKVIKDVRPSLDVVASGSELKQAVRYLASAKDDERIEAWLRLAKWLASKSKEYEWIFFDCPPGDEELQALAMALSRWVVIPTVFDKASRFGLEDVGELFDLVADVNDEVDVLGVLLFGFERREAPRMRTDGAGNSSESREIGQRARVRRALEEDLRRGESDAPVFKAVISNSKTTAEACRQLGKVAGEIADYVASPEWPAISTTLGLTINPDTAEALAADFEDAAVEILGTARQREMEAA